MRSMGVIEECIVPVGQKPIWKTEADPRQDQIVFCGHAGSRRNELYNLLRWDAGRTVIPIWWLEQIERDKVRPFIKAGKALAHPLVGPIVFVEFDRERDEAIVRRVGWSWALLGQWYRIRRRLLILRDWISMNRAWLKLNW